MTGTGAAVAGTVAIGSAGVAGAFSVSAGGGLLSAGGVSRAAAASAAPTAPAKPSTTNEQTSEAAQRAIDMVTVLEERSALDLHCTRPIGRPGAESAGGNVLA